jgi:hypothetical protein
MLKRAGVLLLILYLTAPMVTINPQPPPRQWGTKSYGPAAAFRIVGGEGLYIVSKRPLVLAYDGVVETPERPESERNLLTYVTLLINCEPMRPSVKVLKVTKADPMKIEAQRRKANREWYLPLQIDGQIGVDLFPGTVMELDPGSSLHSEFATGPENAARLWCKIRRLKYKMDVEFWFGERTDPVSQCGHYSYDASYSPYAPWVMMEDMDNDGWGEIIMGQAIYGWSVVRIFSTTPEHFSALSKLFKWVEDSYNGGPGKKDLLQEGKTIAFGAAPKEENK